MREHGLLAILPSESPAARRDDADHRWLKREPRRGLRPGTVPFRDCPFKAQAKLPGDGAADGSSRRSQSRWVGSRPVKTLYVGKLFATNAQRLLGYGTDQIGTITGSMPSSCLRLAVLQCDLRFDGARLVQLWHVATKPVSGHDRHDTGVVRRPIRSRGVPSLSRRSRIESPSTASPRRRRSPARDRLGRRRRSARD